MKPTQAQKNFAHSVRYRDAMLHAWMKRTGQGNSYRPEEVPAYIAAPTNEERSLAETIRFCARPLKAGEVYGAYLTCDALRGDSSYPRAYRITTWTGDTLAHVTAITPRGYWAKGIDGRTYYGRHNGRGMYCTMRLPKGRAK